VGTQKDPLTVQHMETWYQQTVSKLTVLRMLCSKIEKKQKILHKKPIFGV
jgi:hypothetical protein